MIGAHVGSETGDFTDEPLAQRAIYLNPPDRGLQSGGIFVWLFVLELFPIDLLKYRGLAEVMGEVERFPACYCPDNSRRFIEPC